MTTTETEAIALQDGPRFPSAQPEAGQDPQEWRDEVVRLRAQHDAQALGRPLRLKPEVPMASIGYLDLPVAGGEISARIYRPPGEGPLGAVLLFHGGAFWMGGGAASYELNDAYCRAAAVELGAVVLNVDYRLAPEFRFPVQLEDGYSALVHVLEHAEELGVDPARLGLIGISSGGLLAAGLTHLLRERGGPEVDLLVLLAPLLDLSLASDDPVLAALMDRLRAYYVGEGGSVDLEGPALAPLRAGDLAGLPPTVVVTGDRDPLSPQGAAYVTRLVDAGVDAVELSYPMGHGDADDDLSRRLLAEMLETARRVTG